MNILSYTREKIIKVYWKIWQPYYSLKNILRKIKWFIQRGHRGYADCELWSIDLYLSGWLPSAIRKMRDKSDAWPIELACESISRGNSQKRNNKPLTRQQEERLNKEWKRILTKIARGFECSNWLCYNHLEELAVAKVSGDSKRIKRYKLKEKIYRKVSRRGLKLFAKWFLALWA